ncbi:hypothetical protein Tco_0740794 [Tanacetum coccineum]
MDCRPNCSRSSTWGRRDRFVLVRGMPEIARLKSLVKEKETESAEVFSVSVNHVSVLALHLSSCFPTSYLKSALDTLKLACEEVLELDFLPVSEERLLAY